MNRILTMPLLPNSKVTAVAVSAEYTDVTDALKNYEIDCFEIKQSEALHSSVASHADCRIFQIYKNIFICEESICSDFSEFIKYKTGSIVKLLTIEQENTNYNFSRILNDNKTIYIIPEKVSSPYPNDVRLNAKKIGNNILCNINHVSNYVKIFADDMNIKLIHTNQGYSACSTLLLNNNSIITDDASIHSVVHRMEIFSTKIDKGEIKLKDCNYGFIGGCCGFIDKNVIAFTGKLNSLNCGKIIESLLISNNINYIELTDKPMFDIGGIIPLTEEVIL